MSCDALDDRQDEGHPGLLPLGLTPGVDCIRYEQLKSLMEIYNGLPDAVAARCSYTGFRYGDAPHKEDLEDVPTMTGFLRVTMSNDGTTCSVFQTQFILQSGSLLTKIQDTSNYGYLTATYPWYAFLHCACVGCCTFKPETQADAQKTVSCGGGGTLYTSYREMNYSAGPGVCNNVFDWGSDSSRLNKWASIFPCVKIVAPADVSANCTVTKLVCCSDTYAIGRYEDTDNGDGNRRLLLRYVDCLVDSSGSGLLDGYLTKVVKADEINSIKTRAETFVSSNFAWATWFCDNCGPGSIDWSGETGDPPCHDEGTHQNGSGIDCFSDMDFDTVRKLCGLTGKCDPDTGSSDCTGCSTQPLSDQTICACHWEELAAYMQFMASHGCTKNCPDARCCGCKNTAETACTCGEGSTSCCCGCNYVPTSSGKSCQFVGGGDEDDSSCVKCYINRFGCTNPNCRNYNGLATHDDDSCCCCSDQDPVGPDCPEEFGGPCE